MDVIPSSITSVGNWAFEDCNSLTSITLPSSVTSIGWDAFSGTAIRSIVIPVSVSSIESSTFEDCTSLTSITIPSKVTSVGSFAFRGCTSLTSVRVEATTPPRGDGYMFSKTYTSFLSIKVPSASVATYKAAKGWSDYADRITGY